jgi:two-component system cell cycle response regulator
MHLPVVMVTSLDSQADKRRGLEAGADDFLSKPVNDLALVTRVKSLARLKMVTDDLRLRASNGDELAINSFKSVELLRNEASTGRVVIIDSDATPESPMVKAISRSYGVHLINAPYDALIQVADGDFDLAIVSLSLVGQDSLRLCSYLRSLEKTRTLPIVVTAKQGQGDLVSRSLEIGVNDFLEFPLDEHELLARINTQMLRKKYNDCLRDSVQQTIEMAVKDPLTNMHNRRYMDQQLHPMFQTCVDDDEPMSLIMCDIDHFKNVNDTHGHDVGDLVIQACAKRIMDSVRDVDVACRFGGEEFAIAMPNTSGEVALKIAERIREKVEGTPAAGGDNQPSVTFTISLGVATIEEDDTPEKLMKRADLALYSAKREGRNRVACLAA